MKSTLWKICVIGLLASPASFAAPTVFEDFSGDISRQKFDVAEINLNVVSEELVLSSKGKSFSRGGLTNNAFLIDSNGVTNYSADLKLTELSLGNSQTQQALLRLAGDYYFTSVGRAYVEIAIGDRGNGLEAWYTIFNDSYDSNGQYISTSISAQGSLASEELALNNSYRVSINYDGDNGFIFTFDNGDPISVIGPEKVGDSPFWRHAGTRVRFGHNTSTQDIFEDELPENGSTAFVTGTVDNVTTDADRPSDDFSSANLEKWNRSPKSSLINPDQQLEMSVSQLGNGRETQRLKVLQRVTYFGANIALSSNSSLEENARARARVVNYVGNDTYDIGDTPNGWEGNVYTQIALDRQPDGSFRLSSYIERADDADYNSSTEIDFQVLSPATAPAYDVSYDVAIELAGNVVNFIVDGEILHSYDLSTSEVLSENLYPPTDIAKAELNTRVQFGPGKVVALFDDITTNLMPPVSTLNATDSSDENVALPEEVIVNVGEVVTLIAESSNPDDIIRYLWEQISGTNVDIPTASGRTSSLIAASARVVGTEDTFSFTVPAGSDTEDLAFRLTTIANSGLETTEEFSFKVDNTQDSTLSPVMMNEEEEEESSGGGGSLNFFLIFMLLLTFLVRKGLRSNN